MKGVSGWSHKPYRPFDRQAACDLPFVCRIAPFETGFTAEWFDKEDVAHVIKWRLKNSYSEWMTAEADKHTVCVQGLHPYTDYEFMIERKGADGKGSAIRLVRTGKAPGNTVNYLHPEDEIYAFSGRALCSPSLTKLPGGALLASMDVFAPEAPQNLTLIFRSDDGGESWRYVTDLFPCYWGTLFVHRDRLYMLAVSAEYGNLMISESVDEGETWKKPTILFYGGGMWKTSGWQHTPVGFVNHNGRIYTSIDYGAWSQGGHGICLLSASEDADLLSSESWTVSPPVKYDSAWKGAPAGPSRGLLEGNMVVAPDGRLMDVLRVQIPECVPNHGLAVMLEADFKNYEEPMRFDSFVNLPTGANSKTHILRDDQTGAYFAIGNLCVDSLLPAQRNVLALSVSRDLYNWEVAEILLDYRYMNPKDVGFQYIYFLFDGDDIIYLSRTSINGARNFHDANYQTFHRIKDFRRYVK